MHSDPRRRSSATRRSRRERRDLVTALWTFVPGTPTAQMLVRRAILLLPLLVDPREVVTGVEWFPGLGRSLIIAPFH